MSKSPEYKKNSGTKFVAIVFLVVVISAFAGVLSYLTLNAGPQVSAVGCPIDETFINQNIAVLFDTTEPMVPSQAREIDNRMNSIVSQLEEFDRVGFYEVRSDERSAVRKVSLQLGSSGDVIDHFCRQPVSWDDAPARARLTEALPVLISQELLQNVEQGEQSFSPITDALRFIAADVTGKPFPTKIIVVSDMIEHSEILSMYKSDWFESSYSASRQVILNQRPIFPEGTEIEIYLLNRPRNPVQNEELQQYWLQMLTGPGAFSTTSLKFNFVAGGL